MFDEEFDMGGRRHCNGSCIAKSIRPKHGGSVFGRERLRRAMVDGHNQLRCATIFVELVNHIAESMKFHDIPSSSKGGIVSKILGITIYILIDLVIT
jgi:hypothetical protein